MDGIDEFHRVAGEVRNWGRWGSADEIGTLNFITSDKVEEAASLVRKGSVFALGIEFGANGPQGLLSFRGNPIHVMTVDGGDAGELGRYGRDWPSNPVAQQIGGTFDMSPVRFNDDMIIMPLRISTRLGDQHRACGS